MAFNNDLENLIEGLFRPSIFYVPKILCADFSEKTKQELVDLGFFECPIILKADGVVGTVRNRFDELPMLKKTNMLDNNFFQLLKFRDQLSQDSFRFIKNEYLKYVSACLYIYTWLCDNIEIETDCVDDVQKKLFKHQKVAVEEHEEKLKAKFSFIEEFKLRDFSKMPIKVPNLFKDKNYGKLLSDTLKKGKKVKKAQKPKTYKISEGEADEYLLRTVFGVDLSKIGS